MNFRPISRCISGMFLAAALLFTISGSVFSQEEEEKSGPVSFSLGADAVSRYVWRGSQFGGDPHIQPYGSLDVDAGSLGSLSLGVWASYGMNSNFSENDLSLTYSYATPVGNLSVALTDYYYPFAGLAFSNFDGDGQGAHTMELAFSYEGTEELPLRFLISNNIHNDIPGENSLYAEAGYSFDVQDVTLDLFLGGAKGVSSWYGITTDKFELINLGFTASKSVKISQEFSVPLSLQMVYNPYVKNTFVVFKLSI